ncbi:MAG: hypothetical protein E6230_02570 [Paenibacillus dendritiformis]|uniref:XkdQ/YqbQ family protein n=1 Tax=uncultured Paenibacillus sp. TaxID=227322 RepID=UPI0025D01B0C|nr:hypothetical protein [uncultured Paenibacillus sp.]MDU5141057.1 hypothetical protein [Paenibacillus dendritiformis]
MLEVTIDNRDGNLWEISRLVASMKISTHRIGKAGVADITMVRMFPFGDKSFKYGPGDIIRIRRKGVNLFYGVIFVIDESADAEVKITAYDQIRYLAASDTYSFTNSTATTIIKKIIQDSGLKAGTLVDTKYAIPKMLEDGQKLIDIISKALDLTMTAKKQIFVFYDDFGSLTLRNINDMVLNLVLGDKSLVYGYKHKRSIDSDTFNRIKLVRDNKETGVREAYISQDKASMAKWGRLQYYRKVEDGANPAQITQAADNLLKLKNREQRTFTIEALGDPRIRAGNSIYVDLQDRKLNGVRHLVNSCTHTFEGDEHTMSLQLVVFDFESG